MNESKVLLFFIIMNSILILSDYYFLKKWQNKVLKSKWSKSLYKIPWYIFYAMIVILGLLAFHKANAHLINDVQRMNLFILVSIWYLPKIFVTPVFLVKDAINYIKSKFKNTEKIERPIQSPTRRKFAENATWALAGVPFIITGNGVLNTAYDFKVHTLELPIKDLPSAFDGFKIVQISDVHAGSFYSAEPVKRAVELANSLKPQLTVVTGDFVNSNPDEYDLIGRAVAGLKSDFDVTGCLGNHDHYMNSYQHPALLKKISNSGIKLLDNENKIIKIDNEILQIAGVDNIGFNQQYGNFDLALQNLEDAPTVLLCHDPTNWENSIVGNYRVDLMLAGHTHGGQFGYEIAGRQLYPIKLVYKHWAGHYYAGTQHLYVNRGLGMSGPPIRVGVNPEITEIILRKEGNV